MLKGRTIDTGDTVDFKSDKEQTATVIGVRGERVLLKAVDPEGFIGDYIGGMETVEEHASRCWIMEKATKGAR